MTIVKCPYCGREYDIGLCSCPNCKMLHPDIEKQIKEQSLPTPEKQGVGGVVAKTDSQGTSKKTIAVIISVAVVAAVILGVLVALGVSRLINMQPEMVAFDYDVFNQDRETVVQELENRGFTVAPAKEDEYRENAIVEKGKVISCDLALNALYPKDDTIVHLVVSKGFNNSDSDLLTLPPDSITGTDAAEVIAEIKKIGFNVETIEESSDIIAKGKVIDYGDGFERGGRYEAGYTVIIKVSNGKSDVKVTSVKISGASSVNVGESINLNATIKPGEAANVGVQWTSSDSSVATVTRGGKVTGVKAGRVTVTAVAGGVSDSKTIAVNAPVAPEKPKDADKPKDEDKPQEQTTTQQQTTQQQTTQQQTTQQQTTQQQTTQQQTTQQQTKPTTTQPQTPTAAQGDTSTGDSKAVDVAITITPSKSEIQVGDSADIRVTVFPDDSNYTIDWKSSDHVALHGNERLKRTVVGRSGGSATITVTVSKGEESNKEIWKETCTINVKTIQVTRIEITDGYKVALNTEKTYKIEAQVYPNNATNKTLNYAVEDTNIASIDSNGVITAKSPGTTAYTVTATDGSGVSASGTITVNPHTSDNGL